MLPDPSLILIDNGDLYTPDREGSGSVLIGGSRIVKLGEISRRALESSGLGLDVIDASGCLVMPGFIDPHEHLIGGSGERGFESQTPEIYLQELIRGGITTVVGCLGVDTQTRTMPALLGKVKGLRANGISAFLYTGGYPVPPATITGSARGDIMFIEEVIGIGETAIADLRSSWPAPVELARMASEAYNAGLLTNKAGVLHLHVGDDPRRLRDVRTLIDEYHIKPESLYPTHVERSTELFDEAVALTARGVAVDIDVIERDLNKWFVRYRDCGGAPGKLTASSDAGSSAPEVLLNQIRECVMNRAAALEELLPLVTTNTAAVLKLSAKGRLAPGMDADLLVMDRQTLELRAVLAGGRILMRDGAIVAREGFLDGSNRRIRLDGTKEQ